MPACCSTFEREAEQQFDVKKAAAELASYRAKGPGPTTRLLRDGIAASGALSGTLLDVGCGIGALTFELIERGIRDATAVDASSACLARAREEADRRGRTGAIHFVHGDFAMLASGLPGATVVALDRVVCCYADVDALMTAAIDHAERCLALSYPRDVWYVRAGVLAENAGRRLRGKSFRTYVHSAGRIEQAAGRSGFLLASRRETWTWAADVYVRR